MPISVLTYPALCSWLQCIPVQRTLLIWSGSCSRHCNVMRNHHHTALRSMSGQEIQLSEWIYNGTFCPPWLSSLQLWSLWHCWISSSNERVVQEPVVGQCSYSNNVQFRHLAGLFEMPFFYTRLEASWKLSWPSYVTPVLLLICFYRLENGSWIAPHILDQNSLPAWPFRSDTEDEYGDAVDDGDRIEDNAVGSGLTPTLQLCSAH